MPKRHLGLRPYQWSKSKLQPLLRLQAGNQANRAPLLVQRSEPAAGWSTLPVSTCSSVLSLEARCANAEVLLEHAAANQNRPFYEPKSYFLHVVFMVCVQALLISNRPRIVVEVCGCEILNKPKRATDRR